MSLHRFFLTGPLPDGEPPVELPLSAADLHHAVDVLRVHPGERIVVVTPEREAVTVEISSAGPDAVTAQEFGRERFAPEPRVTLVQGLAKGDKLELVIEKAVEIGVEAVLPVEFSRSVVRYSPEKAASKGERWRRVATSAAKQSQRAFVPRVSDPIPASGLLAVLAEYDAVFVLWEEETALGIADAFDQAGLDSASSVALVVGPEGGLAREEVAALVATGARPVTLGRNILRTETAGIVGAALCVYELGGLGGRSRG